MIWIEKEILLALLIVCRIYLKVKLVVYDMEILWYTSGIVYVILWHCMVCSM